MIIPRLARPEQRHPPLEDEQPETLTPRWERARAMPVVADLLPAIVTAIDSEGVTLLIRAASRGVCVWQGDLRKIRNTLRKTVAVLARLK